TLQPLRKQREQASRTPSRRRFLPRSFHASPKSTLHTESFSPLPIRRAQPSKSRPCPAAPRLKSKQSLRLPEFSVHSQRLPLHARKALLRLGYHFWSNGAFVQPASILVTYRLFIPHV